MLNRLTSRAKSWRSGLAAGLALLLAGAAQAQYFSHFETTNLPLNTATSGNSAVTFIPGANNHKFAGGAGTDIVLANLLVSSTTPDPGFDTFNVPYVISISFTDDASGQSSPPTPPFMTFSGTLTGTVSQGAAMLANTPSGPASYSLTLGGRQYVVRLGTYTAPEAPGGRLGAIGAHVSCVPEPSSGLLALSALPLLGLLRRRIG